MKFIKPVKGGAELPTLTTPAAADDISSGKEAIDGNGNLITGEISELTAGNGSFVSDDMQPASVSDEHFVFDLTTPSNVLMRAGAFLQGFLKKSRLGDATAEDVAQGKTFTSSAGMLVTGTKEPGVVLPTLTNPGAAGDLASGKELIDGDGNKVTGSVAETPAGEVLLKTVSKTTTNSTSTQHSHTLASDVLLRAGSIVRLSLTNVSYGDATAADVVAGKTFTAAPGFKTVGTYNPPAVPVSMTLHATKQTYPAGDAYIFSGGGAHTITVALGAQIQWTTNRYDENTTMYVDVTLNY